MIEVNTSSSAETPKGSSFFIDQCGFSFGQNIDIAYFKLSEDRIKSWLMVYILANEKEVYVGETTSVVSRINQHTADTSRKEFTSLTVIHNEEFNVSVSKDYENRLIGLLHADGKYQITNRNEGMADTNYFSREAYAEMFNELWEELRELQLAEHSIEEIEDSEIFKYSPFKGLSNDQLLALDKILKAIDSASSDKYPIVVEGMLGTGKTVLAVYLLKMLKDNPKYNHLNIKLLEPIGSLRDTIKKSVKQVSGLSPEDIIGPADLKPIEGSPGEKRFDILLVDETHRLKHRKNLGTQYGNFDRRNKEFGLNKDATQLDWVLETADLPIFFYDPLQSIAPHCIPHDTFIETLGKPCENPIKLTSQMRVRGGEGYLQYISDILEGKNPEFQIFDNYETKLYENFDAFNDTFNQYLSEHSLSRMIAGYAWEWTTKGKTGNPPQVWDIELDGVKKKWNSVTNNWVGLGFNRPEVAKEVGCIHSIQGYDLSHAFVILGRDIRFDKNTGKLIADKENYFDRNGKATAELHELDQFIRNIYYVLLTRGITGTHIYAVDPVLREHLKKYFAT